MESSTKTPDMVQETQEEKAVPSGTSHKTAEKTEREIVSARVNDLVVLFDLTLAKKREAERRLVVLGRLTKEDLDKQLFRAHAQAHFLPESALASWIHAFRLNGPEGLMPQDWTPLSQRAQAKVTERLWP